MSRAGPDEQNFAIGIEVRERRGEDLRQRLRRVAFHPRDACHGQAIGKHLAEAGGAVSSLLDGVYLHQFMPEQLTGPPGLIGKPLVATEGYANETVWYDAINASPFVAKCIAPVAEGEASRCIRTVYLGPGIAAVYSFDEDVLASWRKFDAALDVPLKQIGAL